VTIGFHPIVGTSGHYLIYLRHSSYLSMGYSRGLKLKTVHGLHWEGKCLRGPQIKMKKALRVALWSPKYRDMLNYFKNGLVWTEIDCEMRKKSALKYANIITNLQYLQFMKEVAGAGRVFETALRYKYDLLHYVFLFKNLQMSFQRCHLLNFLLNGITRRCNVMLVLVIHVSFKLKTF